MNTIDSKATTLRVNRTFSAPVERVFEAWTEPTLMKTWFGCWKISEPEIEVDLRPGGKYKITSTYEDGTKQSMFGEYVEIIPNEKLVFSWTNDAAEFPATNTLVTIEFIAKGAETEVRLKHTNFEFAKSAEGHTIGWTESLDKLAKVLA